jgi:hypothetical protein
MRQDSIAQNVSCFPARHGLKIRAMGKVKRQEWTWVIALAALVVAASTLPYLVGYMAQTSELSFGGSFMDRVDYHTYLAKMWQGYWGEWKYQLPFTTEEHSGAYLVTLYIALGHLARLTGLGLPLVYQLARTVFAFLMLLAVYRFVALFAGSVRTRRAAFLLATIASGLGWLTEIIAPTPPTGVSPMDFWLMDGYTYLAVLVTPHFSAAIALLLAIFVLLLKDPDGPGVREGVLAALASLALGLIHPYSLLLADLVPLLYWSVEALQTRRMNRRGVLAVVAMGLCQLPLLIYDLWVFLSQPVFASWSAQNVTLSPPLRIYLWGYGVLLVLAAIGTVVSVRWRRRGMAFPLLWIFLVAVLAHVPWSLQRRFLEGVQVPLGLLAGVGLAEGCFPVSQGRRLGRLPWLAMASLVVLTAVSNAYLTAGYTWAAASRFPGYFWNSDLLAGVDWLGANTSPQETVLSGFEAGNLIPGRTGHRVVLGHEMETVNFRAKTEDVARFFAETTSDEERLALLERYGVAYVFYGPQERALGAFEPSKASYLSCVFVRGQIQIYQVTGKTG